MDVNALETGMLAKPTYYRRHDICLDERVGSQLRLRESLAFQLGGAWGFFV